MHHNTAKMLHLLTYLREFLACFGLAFSRKAAFENFKVAVTGFLMADVVRYFEYPEPDKLYERLISFFHASSYSRQ